VCFGVIAYRRTSVVTDTRRRCIIALCSRMGTLADIIQALRLPTPCGGTLLNWLIAEDEADIRMLVATMAQVWGHTPMPFESGQKVWDFLDKVQAGEHTDPLPEFALMDIRMPGRSGNEVALKIRGTAPIQNIPIVLMTAFVLTDDERRAMMTDYQVDHIINKPLPDFMELKSLLEGIIARKRNDTAR
jgi:CheY-like chemotaxis protein